MKGKRIVFADQLRFVAFIFVVLTHWVGVYWRHPEVVSSLTFLPPISSDGYDPYASLLLPIPYFNYGPIGVAIFFMISGFVIPYSLNKKSKSGFMISRTLRIYPTYIACAILSLFAAYVLAKLFFSSSPYISTKVLVTNLLLINRYLGIESIDGINWTLAIEMMFYIICATFRNLIVNCKIWIFLLCIYAIPLLAMGIMAVIKLSPSASVVAEVLSVNYACSIFMMSGIFFYWHHSGRITGTTLLSCLMVNIFAFWFYSSYLAHDTPSGPVKINYLYGLVIFGIAYLKRNSFRENKVIDFMAGVSYPYYAMHCIMGLALIRVMCDAGLNYYVALIATFITILGVAASASATIERFSISAGKRF